MLLVPGSTFQVESMDPYTFSGLGNALAFDTSIISNQSVTEVSYFGARLDGIECPVVSSVGTCDLLSNRGEETLSVEESS